MGSALLGSRRACIAAADARCFMTLRRGYDVSLLPDTCYTEAVCMWPHPEHGYLVFPMTLPQASEMELRYPQFSTDGEGLFGEWRIEYKGGKLVLDLIRTLELHEFWTLVRQAGVNPPWLESCFAAYRDVELEHLALLP